MTFELPPARDLHDAASATTAVPSGEASARLADLATLAATTLQARVAVVATSEDERVLMLASHGGDHGHGQLSRDHLIVRTWEQHAPLLVLPDMPADPRCGARFYAGIALRGRAGQRLGTLAVFDHEPRDPPTQAQLDALTRLARITATLLEQRHLERRALIVSQAGEQAREAVLVGDRHGRVRWQNRAAEQLFGNQLAGQPVFSLFPLRLQSDQDIAQAWLAGRIEGSQLLRMVAPDGSLRLLDATRSIWRYGSDRGVTLILHDVTEAAHQRAQLDRLAHFDPLTGLPNRNALLDALAAHPDWGVALFAIDRFKWINDGLGHVVGDRVLQAVADRLQTKADAQVCLARVGGDVFAVACSDERLAADADADATDDEAVVPALVEHLEQTLRVRGHEINIDVSVGIALRGDVRGQGDLLASADLALNRAKSAGGHQVCRYQEAMRTDALARRDLDRDLRRAFANGEFELHYQPQVELGTGRICGAEALLRWRHPQRGMVPASEFIDLLARSPLGAEVGAWVLRRACLDAAQWPDPDTSVSINLFPAQLVESLVAEVQLALAAAALPAERLELEITETIALTQDSAGAEALAVLRSRGVNLAFDDFGTGYASLSMLRRFRIDRVKIDRSFVSGMLENGEDAAIVRWILMLARALGLRVVAEGVEAMPQADWLHDHGCEEAQGYLYAPALDADALQVRLQAQQVEMAHG
ncbi:putative bifunctional diguanylate cyclase/phosphodiesterase [Thermomonas fusca]|uniref:putative bifunctional diguanylate cyclase/phosphodiesterase n=1 Tax=Thermomonas fusca TaxID=215690 RepID=UPI0004205D20|nr:GGDEF domain-containing phosphodiesterase [Thermomonas fusca]